MALNEPIRIEGPDAAASAPWGDRARRLMPWGRDYPRRWYTLEIDQYQTLLRLGWDPSLIGDRLARSLAASRHLLTLPLARTAARFVGTRGWVEYGYARLDDHARERFRRSGRWVRDLRSLAEAADRCPALADAVSGADGGDPIGSVAATAIGRIAAKESCAAWVALARAVTARELANAVRRARSEGTVWPQIPPDPPDSEPAGMSKPEGSDSRCSNEPLPRRLVRFRVPRAVRAAVEEAHDLHRAISGGETSTSAFIEDLIADSLSDTFVDEPEPEARRTRRSLEAREKALEEESHGWRDLDKPGFPDEELADASAALREAARLCREAEEGFGDPDSLIRALIRIDEEIEMRLSELLAQMGEFGAWTGLRFSGVGHYAEERLGLSRTQASWRARLARDLRRRPVLREALEAGRLGPEAASLVVRALRAEGGGEALERSWVERASEATIKRLRDELRFTCRERVLRGSAVPPGPLDDPTWHASRTRRPGQSIERISLLGRAACADPWTLESLHFNLEADLAGMLMGAVVFQCDRLDHMSRETEEGGERSLEAARMFSKAGEKVPEWVGLLAVIEGFVRTWDDPRNAFRRPGDEVYSRDGYRCSAPGCTSRQNLEMHHIMYRSGGGSSRPSNLVTLCRFHHQQGEHGALLRCRGRAPIGVLWWLGRNGKGGFFTNELRVRPGQPIGVLASLFGPLRGEREVGSWNRARTHGGGVGWVVGFEPTTT